MYMDQTLPRKGLLDLYDVHFYRQRVNRQHHGHVNADKDQNSSMKRDVSLIRIESYH
mgnify:CR=1 FL=1